MPTVYRVGKYRFFFNSREETRRHIHVDSPDGTAKFWLEPIVALSVFYYLSKDELTELEKIVKEKSGEFIEEWNRHFGI
ncbi:MAG: hypothetical protein A2014_01875 [Spirochaetes bacterium GWF1_49_6]|nr:MAG: hypothetical protein A2014_01875 [Spirochaetes bacterium GWF1_49_6]